MKTLRSVYVLRYEEFVIEPQKIIKDIFKFIGLPSIKISHEIRKNINKKYYSMWENDREKVKSGIFNNVADEIEQRANFFGYSIDNYENISEVSWLGKQTKQPIKPNTRKKYGILRHTIFSDRIRQVLKDLAGRSRCI